MRLIRIGTAIVLLGFLFVFFVPVIYSSNLSGCHPSVYELSAGCNMLSNPAGLKSIGTVLFGWGATYGFEMGYSTSTIQWTNGVLAPFGVVLLLVPPIGIASILLLSPELFHAISSIKKLRSRL